jgi:2-keto-4-pentenoate hydratase/2-oxohepta-3-ene-1,7-dioic acid hydratase in catechol pathway
MKLCMFTPREMDLERGWPGRIDGDEVVQLAAQTLQAFFTGGGGAREHARYPLADCDFRPPVIAPPSVRIFDLFTASAEPFFSFGPTAPIYGQGQTLALPPGEIDVAAGIAAVIGAEGAIGGFTAVAALVARDVECAERAAGRGPGKSLDGGIALGPVLRTPDEWEGMTGSVTLRVNDTEVATTSLTDMTASWADVVAYAARSAVLRPGDVLFSGGIPAAPVQLSPGDAIEVEIPSLGTLAVSV